MIRPYINVLMNKKAHKLLLDGKMFYLKEKETGEGNVYLGSQQRTRDEHTTPVYNIESIR